MQVLQEFTVLYYPKPGAKAKGHLMLDADDSVHPVTNSERSEFMFSINTAKRSYLMYTDSMEERTKWIAAINAAIASLRKAGPAPQRPQFTQSQTLSLRRASSGDEDSADMLAVAEQHGEQERLRKALLAMLGDDDSPLTRQVVLAAVSSVEWVANSELLSRLLELFKHSIPPPRDEEGVLMREVVSFSVKRCEEDTQLVGLTVAANAAVMVQRAVDFLYASNVADTELQMLQSLLQLVKPDTAALWMELQMRKAVVDAGYAIEVVDDCGAELVRTIGHAKLGEFFAKNASRVSISTVARNCSENRKCFVVTFSLVPHQIEMLYSGFEGFMPLPLTLIKNLRLMSRTQKGDWLRVFFMDDGSVGMVEICVPQADDDFLVQVFKRKTNMVSFRVTATGTSFNVREWRDVLHDETSL